MFSWLTEWEKIPAEDEMIIAKKPGLAEKKERPQINLNNVNDNSKKKVKLSFSSTAPHAH